MKPRSEFGKKDGVDAKGSNTEYRTFQLEEIFWQHSTDDELHKTWELKLIKEKSKVVVGLDTLTLVIFIKIPHQPKPSRERQTSRDCENQKGLIESFLFEQRGGRLPESSSPRPK
ncbi:hypothetical protein OAA91_00780 [Fibrobacterales bacterium]|nr:hypothetical protein [Fibrobacterales bacterium]